MSKRKAPQAQPYVNVSLGSDVKARIGQQLRAMYSDVVNQGVPDRFSEILHRLDQAQAHDEGTDRKKSENRGSNGPSE
jgi:hypothetical protein